MQRMDRTLGRIRRGRPPPDASLGVRPVRRLSTRDIPFAMAKSMAWIIAKLEMQAED